MDVKSGSGSLFRHQENKGKHGRKEARNHLRGPKRRSRIIFQHKKEKEKQRARRLEIKNDRQKRKGSCKKGRACIKGDFFSQSMFTKDFFECF